jgi:hypothetical protein
MKAGHPINTSAAGYYAPMTAPETERDASEEPRDPLDKIDQTSQPPDDSEGSEPPD